MRYLSRLIKTSVALLGVALTAWSPATISTPTPIPPTVAPNNTLTPTDTLTPEPQGFSPSAIAITEDGEYAYIGFDLSEVVFKVRLQNLAVEAVADLSEYFPIECEDIALDASEEKLFVYNPTLRKLLVLDTQTMSVVHTIDDIGVIGMTRSQYGPFLITWDGGNTAKFVNTETYEVTEFTDDSIGFLMIQEGRCDQDQWYVVTGGPDGYIRCGILSFPVIRPGYTQSRGGQKDIQTHSWQLILQTSRWRHLSGLREEFLILDLMNCLMAQRCMPSADCTMAL